MCGSMIVADAAKCRFCNAIFDPQLRAIAAKKRARKEDSTLTGGEWALCILCSTIGCIAGIVYAIQGKPKGLKMVGIAVVVNVVVFVVRVLVELAQNPQLLH